MAKQICHGCSPGEALEPAPFNNKIVEKKLDGNGELWAVDEAGNIYSWTGEEHGYIWGLTLEQKVKMDGLDSVTKSEQREYVKERARKANKTRWEKQRREDASRQGIKNHKLTR